jgi:hypothetical protein
VSLRDDIETVLRAWNTYEVNRGATPIIDYDFYPGDVGVESAGSRLAVLQRLDKLAQAAAESGETVLTTRLDADRAYLRALLGERAPLDAYVYATQGCRAAGWSDSYIVERGELARGHLDAIGISWGPDTERELTASEGPIEVDEAPEAVRAAATDLEPVVRAAVSTNAPYQLAIETTDLDAYWAYWLDGAGSQARLRLNLRRARFTAVRARQFALHEVLGHALQGASLAQQCVSTEVPWVRLLSVHTPQQVLFEGLAQALPLFVVPYDTALTARVRLDHYLQLVRAELHLAVNSGVSVEDCARHARARVPFWTDEDIADSLSDRGANLLLRSYLWAYPAGIDWFVSLADSADARVITEVLHAAYRAPLTPGDLAALWPAGPPIGGPGHALRLWQPDVSGSAESPA